MLMGTLNLTHSLIHSLVYVTPDMPSMGHSMVPTKFEADSLVRLKVIRTAASSSETPQVS